MIDTSNALDMPGRAGSIRKELIDEEMFPFDWFEFERPRSNVLYDKHRLKLKDFAVLQATLEGQAFVGLDCAENVTALDVLALDAAGDVIKASKGDANKSKVIGFAATTTTLGNLVRVITGGELSGFAGLTINALVYLDTDGGYTQTYGDIGTGEYVVVLGVATAVDTIQISIHQPLIWDKYDGPTYSELQDGYVQAGGNITPTVPTIAICRAVATKAIELKWDRQLNLTNFDRYEVQVSSDDATWYSLEFDGSDWKDTLNADTDWQVETLIHPNIPHGGVASAPTGTTLYYRVRRVTKVPAVSAWSVSASTTTNTVAVGDLAADSIYANNIIAAQALIMLLRSAQLWIGYDGTGSYDSPDEGDRRIYLDGDEIRFQEYTNGAWSSVNQIVLGGVDADGVFLPFLGCRGLYNTESPAGEPIPDSTYKLFDFNGDFLDQDGVDWWTTETNVTTAAGKFGNCLTRNADAASNLAHSALLGHMGYWTPGEDQAFAFWFKIVSLPGAPRMFFQLKHTDAASDETYFQLSLDSSVLTLSCLIDGVASGSVETAAGAIVADTWHFLGVVFDRASDTQYLVVDNAIYSGAVTDNWATVDAALSVSIIFWLATGVGQERIYIDDLILRADRTVDPDLFLQHYLHELPWSGDYSALDVLLKPATGGVVRLLGDVAVSGDLFSPSGKVYDTGWINRSDWTNVHLGSDTTLNTDSNVTHNLNAPLSDLLVKVFISTDGTDANSFEACDHYILYVAAYFSQGYTVRQVDNNNICVQTGLHGLSYLQDTGAYLWIDTEDWYYKVKVWYLG